MHLSQDESCDGRETQATAEQLAMISQNYITKLSTVPAVNKTSLGVRVFHSALLWNLLRLSPV